jgi:hypothetical protein
MKYSRKVCCVIFWLSSVILAAGCVQTPEDTGENKDQSKTAENKNIVEPTSPGMGDVVFAVVGGKTMVLRDLQPEAATLVKLDPAKRDEYLMKRAFASLDHKTMAKSPYKDNDRCVVRFVLLTSIDQYNRPVWGSAVEIAKFEIDLSKVRQSGKTVTALKEEDVTGFFVAKIVYRENIKEQPISRINIQ